MEVVAWEGGGGGSGACTVGAEAREEVGCGDSGWFGEWAGDAAAGGCCDFGQ